MPALRKPLPEEVQKTPAPADQAVKPPQEGFLSAPSHETSFNFNPESAGHRQMLIELGLAPPATSGAAGVTDADYMRAWRGLDAKSLPQDAKALLREYDALVGGAASIIRENTGFVPPEGQKFVPSEEQAKQLLLETLSTVRSNMGISYSQPESASLASSLPKKEMDCNVTTTLFIDILGQLGIDSSMAVTEKHAFLAVPVEGGKTVYFETTAEGSYAPEARERLRAPENVEAAFEIYGSSRGNTPLHAIRSGQQSQDAEAYAERGTFLFQQGDKEGAIALLQLASKMDPTGFSDANLGRAYNAAGNYPAAIASFEEAIRKGPQFLSFYEGLAGNYYMAGDLAAYQKLLEDTARKEMTPDNFSSLSHIRSTLAYLYYEGGEFEKGKEMYSELLRSNVPTPSLPSFREMELTDYMAKFDLFNAALRGDKRSELVALETAWLNLSFSPDSVYGRREAALLAEFGGAQADKLAEVHGILMFSKIGISASDRKRAVEAAPSAIRLCNEILEAQPKNDVVLRMQGELYTFAGEGAKAKADFDAAYALLEQEVVGGNAKASVLGPHMSHLTDLSNSIK